MKIEIENKSDLKIQASFATYRQDIGVIILNFWSDITRIDPQIIYCDDFFCVKLYNNQDNKDNYVCSIYWRPENEKDREILDSGEIFSDYNKNCFRWLLMPIERYGSFVCVRSNI